MIGFAGLSHLGIVSSISAASKGYQVVAYDPNPALCDRLRGRDLPIVEPELQALLDAQSERLRFTSDAAALRDCALIFLSIDTPTNATDQSDFTPLERLFDRVSAAASDGATLVVLSQVPPGFTRRHRELLDRHEHGRRLVLCYQVETLIFGRAVERALHPERIIVGVADPDASLPAPYADFLRRFDCRVLRMRYESAELAKIAINLFLVSAVSTTNALAELCEAIGAEWSEIAPALRLDRRIGPHAYLAPGLGLSGGNLERDVATVRRLAAEHGTDGGVFDAWVNNSRRRRDWTLKCLEREGLMRPGASIAVWGLAYKPDTASIKNSPTIPLLEALADVQVSAYDPVASLPPGCVAHVRRAATALGACAGADALVVMTPWSQFGAMDVGAIAAARRGRVMVDPFSAFETTSVEEAGFVHYKLGSAVRKVVAR